MKIKNYLHGLEINFNKLGHSNFSPYKLINNQTNKVKIIIKKEMFVLNYFNFIQLPSLKVQN